MAVVTAGEGSTDRGAMLQFELRRPHWLWGTYVARSALRVC